MMLDPAINESEKLLSGEMSGKPILYFGTYDLGKPRNRIMIAGLREQGQELREVHIDIWADVEDKSQVGGIRAWVRRGLRWLTAYPKLITRYLKSEHHDVVVVGYLGQLDVLVLWPFAKWRGAHIVWDMFISLYDTVVRDRQILSAKHPGAWLLWIWECLACRAADMIVLDTKAHAENICGLYGVPREKLSAVLVGAESELFPRQCLPLRDPASPIQVLFYGQFIPLHGIETIVEAAKLDRSGRIHWTIIGQGQEADRIKAQLSKEPIENLQWIRWVEYQQLIDHISSAHICLGIFGSSRKAAAVIPNKAYQILAAGRPLITRDSPAIRELLEPNTLGVRLIPCGNAAALPAAIFELYESGEFPDKALLASFSKARIGAEFLEIIRKVN